jgi:acylphosphatase
VQGVGFRPFAHQLARLLGLTGYVFNLSSGVTIEIEGGAKEASVFLNRLRVDPPELATVTDIRVSEVEANGDTSFCILPSRDEVGAFALVSTDVGTCDACWRDFGNPVNRRYGYRSQIARIVVAAAEQPIAPPRRGEFRTQTDRVEKLAAKLDLADDPEVRAAALALLRL